MRSLVAAIAASFLLAGCSGSSGSSGDGGGGGPVCGDGTVSAPEVCDGPALGGKDCTTVPGGFVRGTLACAADCAAFDTAGCAGPACGDGIVSAPEVCDGADLGGKDCTTIPGGYVGGTLACAAGCLDFADARCALPPGPTCTYAGAICFRFEGAQGQALADLEAWCVKSTAAYAALGTCSTDGADPGYCEIPDLAFFGLSVPGVTARAYFYPPTIPASSATSTCEGIRGTWGGVGAWTCGDGVVTGMEACDGANLGGATCTSLGAAGGTLACAADCLSLDGAGCSTTLSCYSAAGHACRQLVASGVPPPGFLAQFEADCAATMPGGAYAAAPCPTADSVGRCEYGSGEWMVFYVPTDPAMAQFLCAWCSGTWVSP